MTGKQYATISISKKSFQQRSYKSHFLNLNSQFDRCKNINEQLKKG